MFERNLPETNDGLYRSCTQASLKPNTASSSFLIPVKWISRL